MRLKLLKLFFSIASIIVFLETSALAKATLTHETVIRPEASGLTNSEGNTIGRDAFQQPTGLAFSNDGKKVFSTNQTVTGNHECISMMTLSTPYDLRTVSLVVDEATPMVTQVGLDDNHDDSRCSDIQFSKDGLKMFLANGTGKIFGFDLSTPFDLSNITYSNNVTGDLGDYPSFRFSNDGKKLIYLDGKVETQHIDEYSLSTAYDLTDITLINTLTLTTTANVNSQDYGKAVEFSQDGMTMFVLIYDHTAQSTANLDTIFQFSLTTAFSTSTATLNGSMIPSGIFNTAAWGMTFSPTGNKLYIVNRIGSLDANYYVGGGSVDVVTQIGLSCDYGLVACVSDSKSSLGTQVQLAKNNVSINTSIIFKRFEWIKRNRNSNNLNNLAASIKLDNPILNYWLKKLPTKIVSVNGAVENGRSITIGHENKNSNNSNNFTTAIKSDNPLLDSWMNKLPENITAFKASLKEKPIKDEKSNWSYWSHGDLTIGTYHGKSGGAGINLEKPKNIYTTGITFGADKKNGENNFSGYAIRYADGKSNFAESGHSTTMDSLTLNYYFITPLKENGYTNTVVGLSLLKYDLMTGGVSTGQRNGKQLFTSIDFRNDRKHGRLNFTPSLKIKSALTKLSDFTEFMTNTSSSATNIIYEKERFISGDLATGILFNSDPAKYTGIIISHNGGLEFVYDYSPDIIFAYSYAGSSNTQLYKVENYSKKNIRVNYGIESLLDNNITL